MSTVKVKTNAAQQALMNAIGNTINAHTMIAPMRIEDIVTVMGFATGCAVGQGITRSERRKLRELVVANIDYGMAMIQGESSPGIVLPN